MRELTVTGRAYEEASSTCKVQAKLGDVLEDREVLQHGACAGKLQESFLKKVIPELISGVLSELLRQNRKE